VSPKSRRRRPRNHAPAAVPPSRKREPAPDSPPQNKRHSLFFWLFLLAILAASVYVMPDLVNGFAYLTGHDNAATFLPQAHEQVCTGRYGCSTETTGILVTGHMTLLGLLVLFFLVSSALRRLRRSSGPVSPVASGLSVDRDLRCRCGAAFCARCPLCSDKGG